jgi:hypothetical protein
MKGGSQGLPPGSAGYHLGSCSLRPGYRGTDHLPVLPGGPAFVNGVRGKQRTQGPIRPSEEIAMRSKYTLPATLVGLMMRVISTNPGNVLPEFVL